MRELFRIDADAALGAAVRHVDRRIFHRHPGRQRHHFRQRHVLVKAHAALAGAARDVVLHAVAFKMRDGAVVHVNRHIDNQNALGALEGFSPARQIAQIGNDAVHLLQVIAPRPEVVSLQIRRQDGGRSYRAFAEIGCL